MPNFSKPFVPLKHSSSPPCMSDPVSPPSSDSPSPLPLYLQSVPSFYHWEDGFFDYLSKIDYSAVTISSVAQGSIIFPRVQSIVFGVEFCTRTIRVAWNLKRRLQRVASMSTGPATTTMMHIILPHYISGCFSFTKSA